MKLNLRICIKTLCAWSILTGILVLTAMSIGLHWSIGAIFGTGLAIAWFRDWYGSELTLRDVLAVIRWNAYFVTALVKEKTMSKLSESDERYVDAVLHDLIVKFRVALADLEKLARCDSDAATLSDGIPSLPEGVTNPNYQKFVLSTAFRMAGLYLDTHPPVTRKSLREKAVIGACGGLLVLASLIDGLSPLWRRKNGSRPHWTAQ